MWTLFAGRQQPQITKVRHGSQVSLPSTADLICWPSGKTRMSGPDKGFACYSQLCFRFWGNALISSSLEPAMATPKVHQVGPPFAGQLLQTVSYARCLLCTVGKTTSWVLRTSASPLTGEGPPARPSAPRDSVSPSSKQATYRQSLD